MQLSQLSIDAGTFKEITDNYLLENGHMPIFDKNRKKQATIIPQDILDALQNKQKTFMAANEEFKKDIEAAKDLSAYPLAIFIDLTPVEKNELIKIADSKNVALSFKVNR